MIGPGSSQLARWREDRSGCSWWVLIVFFVGAPVAVYLCRAVVERQWAAVVYFTMALGGLVAFVRWYHS